MNDLEKLDHSQVTISKESLFSLNGLISKVGNQILIELDDNDLMLLIKDENIDNVKVESNTITFILDSFSIVSNHSKISNIDFLFKTVCSSNIIKRNFEAGFSKYKCFIKTDLARLNTFFLQHETVTYQDDHKNYLYKCIRVDIEIGVFDITQISLEDHGFFVIESERNIDFNFFEDICFAIKQALGFISGYMPGGEEFYFNEDAGFKYVNYMRPAINAMYRPIDWNPNSFLSDKPEIAKKFEGKLNVVSLNVFSNLVYKIYKSKELSSSIIILLESSSVRSYLLIPSVFAVIIESLSKIIVEDEEGRMLPIENLGLAKQIKDEFSLLIDQYSNNIHPDGVIKLKRRIGDLNKPVIKTHLTNNEKLTLPFEQLGLLLTMDDINVIEHRNDLLHGNILLLDEGIPKSETEVNNYMAYVSSKLYTLISALILKYSGYEGYIINYSKFYESRCNIETNEDYYRLI